VNILIAMLISFVNAMKNHTSASALTILVKPNFCKIV